MQSTHFHTSESHYIRVTSFPLRITYNNNNIEVLQNSFKNMIQQHKHPYSQSKDKRLTLHFLVWVTDEVAQGREALLHHFKRWGWVLISTEVT